MMHKIGTNQFVGSSKSTFKNTFKLNGRPNTLESITFDETIRSAFKMVHFNIKDAKVRVG